MSKYLDRIYVFFDKVNDSIERNLRNIGKKTEKAAATIPEPVSSDQIIEQRVKKIIVDQLNVNEEQVTSEASFLDDLGADSLDTVELIMAFEEEFSEEIDGEIPESDAEKMQTVGAVIAYITEKAG